MMNKHSVGSKNRHRGFTLIELMIVLVIVAILALIAYNVYTSYAGGGQHSDAKAAMRETAQPMPGYYVAHNQYRAPQSALFTGLHTSLPSKVTARSA